MARGVAWRGVTARGRPLTRQPSALLQTQHSSSLLWWWASVHASHAHAHAHAQENLTAVPKLKVLYLYDNEIGEMEGMEPEAVAEGASRITHLYLQNNIIERMDGLMRLQRLEKL